MDHHSAHAKALFLRCCACRVSRSAPWKTRSPGRDSWVVTNENHGRWPRLEVAATCVRQGSSDTRLADTTRVMTTGPIGSNPLQSPWSLGEYPPVWKDQNPKLKKKNASFLPSRLSQVSSRFCCSLAASYLTNSASTCHVDSEVFNNLATKKATR